MVQKRTLAITTFYRSQWANYNSATIKLFIAKTVAQLLKMTKHLSARRIFCSLHVHGEIWRNEVIMPDFPQPRKRF